MSVFKRDPGRWVVLRVSFALERSAQRDPGRWVVLRVSFALERSALSAAVRYADLARRLGIKLGASAPLPDVREAVLGLRRAKGMVLDSDDPDSVSAGSFFTNPCCARAPSRGCSAGRRIGSAPTSCRRRGRSTVAA